MMKCMRIVIVVVVSPPAVAVFFIEVTNALWTYSWWNMIDLFIVDVVIV